MNSTEAVVSEVGSASDVVGFAHRALASASRGPLMTISWSSSAWSIGDPALARSR